MRRRSDKNQSDVVDELRKRGFSVQILSGVGQGVPDLLIGKWEINFLVELKSGKKWMTDDEQVWHAKWKGHAIIASSVEEIVEQFELYLLHLKFGPHSSVVKEKQNDSNDMRD